MNLIVWLLAAWNSSQALAIAFRTLTGLTIACSIMLFVVKVRQDTLSAKKAREQALFISEQADKIVKQEQNISEIAIQASEFRRKAEFLSKQAINAERNVADTYDVNGVHRIRQGGKVTMIVGPETEVFRQMLTLQESKSWDKLLILAQAQVLTTPTWLSPYMFAGVAARHLGDMEEARRLFAHVLERAGDDPSYREASRLLSSLPGQTQ